MVCASQMQANFVCDRQHVLCLYQHERFAIGTLYFSPARYSLLTTNHYHYYSPSIFVSSSLLLLTTTTITTEVMRALVVSARKAQLHHTREYQTPECHVFVTSIGYIMLYSLYYALFTTHFIMHYLIPTNPVSCPGTCACAANSTQRWWRDACGCRYMESSIGSSRAHKGPIELLRQPSCRWLTSLMRLLFL